jgi:hypothetical protein
LSQLFYFWLLASLLFCLVFCFEVEPVVVLVELVVELTELVVELVEFVSVL